MEPIGKLINQSQVIVPQELSPTSTTLKLQCGDCKQEFTAKVWYPINGDSKRYYPTRCPTCDETHRKEGRVLQLKDELEKTGDTQRILWYAQCNIQGKYWDCNFANFDKSLQPKAYEVVKNYDKKTSIVLISPDIYGVGKTHLVSALALFLIENEEAASISNKTGDIVKQSCPVYFTTEAQMLARIRATFNNANENEREIDVYKKLLSVPLLIIDDVGKVRPKDFSFLQGVYYQVIDGRYINEDPVILTSNLSFVELEKHIGGACADRLKEMCGKNFIKMAGKSQRGIIKSDGN